MYSTNDLYFNACVKLGLKPIYLKIINGFRVELGKRIYYFRESITPYNNSASVLHAYELMRFTKCITLNELSVISLEEFKIIRKSREKFKTYNIVVFFGKILTISQRLSSHIVGDGEKTLAELIGNYKDEINHGKFSQLAQIENVTEIKLSNDNYLRMNAIPGINEKIPIPYKLALPKLNRNIKLNLNTICQKNKVLILKAAQLLELKHVGFELICKDIRSPISQKEGYITRFDFGPAIVNDTPIEQEKMSLIIVKNLIYLHPLGYLFKRMSVKRNCFAVHLFWYMFFYLIFICIVFL